MLPLPFKRDMELAFTTSNKVTHYSPMLHNAILCIALCFCEEPHLQSSITRKRFALHAKTFIETEGMNPSIATVQAFALLASYHSLAAEHNLGWLSIGTAVRCGLTRE